ncbi:MAG: hypothetical protein K2N94_06300 [Lachnospiraceae bacterium]|nr:hypothetical protein [Lachnospiraceae bacterium]
MTATENQNLKFNIAVGLRRGRTIRGSVQLCGRPARTGDGGEGRIW